MDVMNCPRCGKMFKRMTASVCEDCIKLEEKEFDEVRKYLDENPNSTLAVVAEVTKTSSKRILKWIKEGRIEMTAGMHGELRCVQCNKPIKSGRFCDACIIDVNEKVTGLFEKKKSSAGMHTFGKKNK